MIKELNKSYQLVLFNIIAAFLFALFILSLNYSHYPSDNIKDYLLITIHCLLVASGCYAIICLISIHRYIFLLLFPLFSVVTATGVFFVWQFDIAINSALIQSILNTSREESFGLISSHLIIYVLFILSMSIFLIFWRFKIKPQKKDYLINSICITLAIIVFQYGNTLRYNTLMQRIPFSYYLATKTYCNDLAKIKADRIMLGKGAICNEDSLTVVFILGEAARADHLSINGYYRPTTPLLSQRDVVSFKNIHSPYTHTGSSVPYILSRADASNPDLIYSESSFIDIFKACHFRTVWLGNQIPVTSYQFFIHECDTIIINKPQFNEYSNVKLLDSDLIPLFEKQLQNKNPKQLIALQLIGNHYWYNSHYPDSMAFFQPILKSKAFSKDQQDQFINSYDNCLRFTDFVIDQMLDRLENRKALVIFLADHGESLGENNKWLHANDIAIEKNPACFVWISKPYQQEICDKTVSLIANKDKVFDTSFLFHTILDGANIQSKWLDPKMSLFFTYVQP